MRITKTFITVLGPRWDGRVVTFSSLRQTVTEASLTDSLLSAAEGAEDYVAKFTSLARAKD